MKQSYTDPIFQEDQNIATYCVVNKEGNPVAPFYVSQSQIDTTCPSKKFTYIDKHLGGTAISTSTRYFQEYAMSPFGEVSYFEDEHYEVSYGVTYNFYQSVYEPSFAKTEKKNESAYFASYYSIENGKCTGLIKGQNSSLRPIYNGNQIMASKSCILTRDEINNGIDYEYINYWRATDTSPQVQIHDPNYAAPKLFWEIGVAIGLAIGSTICMIWCGPSWDEVNPPAPPTPIDPNHVHDDGVMRPEEINEAIFHLTSLGLSQDYDYNKKYGLDASSGTIVLNRENVLDEEVFLTRGDSKEYKLEYSKSYQPLESNFDSEYETITFEIHTELDNLYQMNTQINKLLKVSFDSPYAESIWVEPKTEIYFVGQGFSSNEIYEGTWTETETQTSERAFDLVFDSSLYYDLETESMSKTYSEYEVDGFMLPLTSQSEWGTMHTSIEFQTEQGEEFNIAISAPIGTDIAYVGEKNHHFNLL